MVNVKVEQLRSALQNIHGEWWPISDKLIDLDPEFFEAYINLASVPFKSGNLQPKIREFIQIAINASVTHLHESALRAHIRNALSLGGTQDEIVEVLQLTSVLGIHAVSMGYPLLAEEARRAGRSEELHGHSLSDYQKQLKERFKSSRGFWNDIWEIVLTMDPEIVSAYCDFSSIPWRKGALEAKTKELIYIAIDASTTHLYERGTRGHMKNALAHGATVAEIMEVLQLACLLGIQTCTLGLPILHDELERHAKLNQKK